MNPLPKDVSSPKRTYRPVAITSRRTVESAIQTLEKKTGQPMRRPKETNFPRSIAEPLASHFCALIRPSVSKVSIAGSLRRGHDNVHDIDILITPPDEAVRAMLTTQGNVLLEGKEKLSILHWIEDERYAMGEINGGPSERSVDSGRTVSPEDRHSSSIQIDFRFIETTSWGPAIQYFTGSWEHNVSLRRIAKRKGFILNERGLWSSTGERIDDNTEGSIYTSLGLRWLPPRYRNGYIGFGRTTLTQEERNEPKKRCPVCDHPLRESILNRHITECHSPQQERETEQEGGG